MANKINYTGSSKILIRICQAINDLIDNGGGGGSYTLPTASSSTKGGVKIGSGLSMNGEVLNNTNPTPYSLPTASSSTKGGVKIGNGLSMSGDTLNNTNPTPYSLPTASANVLGGVKIGQGISINNGVISVPGGGGGGSTVSVEQIQTSGTKIATITVDGNATDLYAPSDGGGGSDDPRLHRTLKIYALNGDLHIGGVATD